MASTTPKVWVSWWGKEKRAEVEQPGTRVPPIALDTPAWVMWLEAPTTSSFAYPIYDQRLGYIRGFMSVRKERRQRGSAYWVAYRRSGGRLRKIYLGRSGQLTLQQLGKVAERFLAMESTIGLRTGDDGQAAGRR